jgi:outer membrane lipoprotein-sorting protein
MARIDVCIRWRELGRGNQGMRYGTYSLLIGAIVILSSIAPSPAQNGSKGSSSPKLLEQARAAIASASKMDEIKSLSASFNIRQLLSGGGQMTGEVQLDFLFPDKFIKNEKWTLPGNAGQIISSFLLNGEQTWSDTRATNSRIPVLRDDPADAENGRIALLQRLRKENAFYLFQLLLITPSYLSVEFIHVGEAQAEDGRADVLDAKGLNDFAVRLFFDKESHRPLLMSYLEPGKQRVPLSRGKPDKTSDQPGSQSNVAKGPGIEVQFHFSDYRAEDGITVPHLITQERNGKIIEEKELKRLKINPLFKPDHFEVKRKS